VSQAATQPAVLPISALVPTLERRAPLARMLDSLAQQSAQPAELIVVDASASGDTKQLFETAEIPGLLTKIVYRRATETGAAIQRQQALAEASQETVWFLDDDVLFEEDCLKHLWAALQSDTHLGGVNAMITNQRYFPPGRVSQMVFRLLHGHAEESYAGKCIGPAFNLLPEDDERLPDCVEVEWLNTTCTLYRRAALPVPLFAAHFKGYSYLEDVALSLIVGRKWKLANARRARIFHDTQPGAYKSSAFALAKMELVNRHYVMTQVLGRRAPGDYAKLAFLETFIGASRLVTVRGWLALPATLLGKLTAIPSLVVNSPAKTDRSPVSPSST
jgi:glycosyltransferase involved in cell wall biosynthesis